MFNTCGIALFLIAMRLLFILICYSHSVLGQPSNPFEIYRNSQKAGIDSSSVSSVTPVIQHDDSLKKTVNPFELTVKPTSSSEIVSQETKKDDFKPSESRVNATSVTFSFFCLILLAIGLGINRSRYFKMIRSVVNSNYLKTLMRSKNLSSDFQLFLLYAMALKSMSLVIYLIVHLEIFQFPGLSKPSYFKILLFLTSLYGVRHIAMWMLEAIFPIGGNAVVFGYSIAYHNVTAGTVMLPFVFALQFGPGSITQWLAFAGIFCFLCIFILRQFKGGLLALGVKGFNPIYFFLYLCAVEIAPILIGIRVVFNSL